MQVSNHSLTTFYSIAALSMMCFAGAIYMEQMMLLLIPILMIGSLYIIKDYRLLFYGFLCILPFSIEYSIGSFGTDLPSEPIMLGLSLVGMLLITRHIRDNTTYLSHGISLLIGLHLAWILISMLFSSFPVLSLKFLIAKSWYVLPFFILPFFILDRKINLMAALRSISYALLVAVMIVLFRHSREGFSFETYNEVVYPIFRNHVNYAAMIVVVLPWTWALYKNTRSAWERKFLIMTMLIFAAGTYFSYTRAAQGSILLMIAGFYILRFRLTKYVLAMTLVGAISLALYLTHDNKFLKFAPNYEKTITQDSYDNLVDATIKLEDISTMERVYRWVSAGYMIGKRPIIGYGPSTFYSNYKKYSVTDFKTYVSDNPEKSGMHNYYLMTWVEQGSIGLLIFLSLLFYALWRGEEAYYKHRHTRKKYFVAGAWLSLLTISILNLMNDLIEVDKVGPFFFLSLAIIAIYDNLAVEKSEIDTR